jgi:hypothetical protein
MRDAAVMRLGDVAVTRGTTKAGVAAPRHSVDWVGTTPEDVRSATA